MCEDMRTTLKRNRSEKKALNTSRRQELTKVPSLTYVIERPVKFKLW